VEFFEEVLLELRYRKTCTYAELEAIKSERDSTRFPFWSMKLTIAIRNSCYSSWLTLWISSFLERMHDVTISFNDYDKKPFIPFVKSDKNKKLQKDPKAQVTPQ